MATQTSNFGFTKPDVNEFYDVEVQNENLDKIDETLKQNSIPANIGAAKVGHKHNASDINSGTLSSDRLPVIPVTKGGTGASNSSQARANLGIAEEYWTFTLEDGSTVTKLVCAT